MALLNRIVTAIIALLLLVTSAYMAALPLGALTQIAGWADIAYQQLAVWYMENPMNFLIGQIAFGVFATLLFGALFWFERWPHRQRGVRVQTARGSNAELDPDSISRYLEWRLDQLAEIITVVPIVRPKGEIVHIKLEIETSPDTDVPTKTDEVIAVAKTMLEKNMGLRLGKLDVHMHYAPFEPEWLGVGAEASKGAHNSQNGVHQPNGVS